MDVLLIITWISIFAGWFFYKKVKRVYDELEEMNIPYEGAIKGYKDFYDIIMMKDFFQRYINDQYNRFKGQQIVPSFSLSVRNFLIRDADIVKQITIKDFDSFVNHDRNFNQDLDKMNGLMLFSLFDDEWRNMRNILSPIFTSSKMKMMFGILSDCVDDFMTHYEEKVSKTGSLIINSRDTFARFTIDGICSTVLGFKGDCIVNEDSKLYKFSRTALQGDIWAQLKQIFFFFAPKIYKFLGLQMTKKEVLEFFHDAIVKVMKERDEKGIFRPDVIQLLLQAKKGQLQMQDKENEVNEAELSNFSANIEYDVKAKNKKLTNWTDEHFMAQGFIFFAAGSDTTHTLLQVLTLNLARNKDIQQRLIDEVDEVAANLGESRISFETLHKMKYLDMTVCEALRIWPPAVLTLRECNRDYLLKLKDGKSIKLREGDILSIPVNCIHNDERYFEDPEKFDPERFSDERKGSIVDGSFIPFGSGPRVCIGSRFALMEVKLLIFNILTRFTFDVCDKTPEKLWIKPSFTNFEFEPPIFVEMKARK